MSRRAFSIAITACAAKFSSRAICLSGNTPGSRRKIAMKPTTAPSLSSGTARARGHRPVRPGHRARWGTSPGVASVVTSVAWTGFLVAMPRAIRAALLVSGFRRLAFGESGRDAQQRHPFDAFAIVRQERAERRPAQPHRPLQHRIEHRCQIARRRVDHLQHLGGRGLLFQRLALFGDQPCVLDRDHRLIGEGADKLDLPVGERFDPLAREHDHPDHLAFAQQRHAERGPLLAQRDRASDSLERRPHREYVRAVSRARLSLRRSARLGHTEITPRSDSRPRIQAEIRNSRPTGTTSPSRRYKIDLIGIAKPRGGLDHRVEHRLQIERRAADDLQHVAGRGLVFQRFLKIGRAGLQCAIRLGAADRDHRLVGEGF